MEWLDKIKDFPNLIQQEPRYGIWSWRACF